MRVVRVTAFILIHLAFLYIAWLGSYIASFGMQTDVPLLIGDSIFHQFTNFLLNTNNIRNTYIVCLTLGTFATLTALWAYISKSIGFYDKLYNFIQPLLPSLTRFFKGVGALLSKCFKLFGYLLYFAVSFIQLLLTAPIMALLFVEFITASLKTKIRQFFGF